MSAAVRPLLRALCASSFALPAVLLGLAILSPAPLHAQDDDEALTRWVFQGEFTSVLAQGNAESLTLGLGSTLRRRWERDAVRFEAGAVRANATRFERRAVGTESAFDVQTNESTETTAEIYFARGRYDRTLSKRLFAFGGLDWLRNTPAGIESRFLLAAGGGTTWADGAKTRFSTSYAATYTFQSDVVTNPFIKSDFAGVRLGWELFRQVSDNAEFDSQMVSDMNIDDTGDLRVDLVNSLKVQINSALALKPSLQTLWRNQPSLTRIPLFTPAGGNSGQTVAVPLRKLDTFFRLALVVTL